MPRPRARPAPRRRIMYFLASSADGFIARPDGDVGWLERPWPKDHYGMPAFERSVDTVLMGRRTYDVSRRFGESRSGKRYYVFTRRPPDRSPAGVEFVSGDVATFAQYLRRAPGKHIWLMGGGELAAAFLDAGELDDVILYVIPVMIGQGIPLFGPGRRAVELNLVGSRKWTDGVVRVHYRGLGGPGRGRVKTPGHRA